MSLEQAKGPSNAKQVGTSEQELAEALRCLSELSSEATLRGLLAHEHAWRELASRWGACP